MSSVSFDRPSTKLILSAIGIVVILHVLTAIALTLVKTPTPVIEPLQETPPIEIELLTIADTTSSGSDSDSNDGEANNAAVIDAEEATTEEAQTEPETQAESEIESAVEPQVEIEQELETETQPDPEIVEPIVESQSEPEMTEPEVTEPEVTEVEVPEPKVPEKPYPKEVETTPPPATEPELKSGVITSTKTTITSSSSNSGPSQSSPSTSAPAAETYGGGYTQHSTIPTAPTTSSIANNNVGRSSGSSKKSQGQDNIKKPPKASSNEPVTYGSINDSSWQIPPDFRSIQKNKYKFKNLELSIEVRFSVDINGNISNIEIIKRSDDNSFDRDVERALLKAKLKPTTIDEKPVKSVASFKFRMKQQ